MRFALEVAREVKRVISAHAKGPFLQSYRISPEEREERGYRVLDICALVNGLIAEDIDYLHASLNDVLGARLLGADTRLTAKQVIAHVANRVPVLASRYAAYTRADPGRAQSGAVASGRGHGAGDALGLGGIGTVGPGCGAQIRQELELDERAVFCGALWRGAGVDSGAQS